MIQVFLKRSVRSLPKPLLMATGAILLAIAGSLGPWAKVSGQTISGEEFPGFLIYGTDITDGLAALVMVGAAGLLVLWRLARPRLTGFVLGVALLLLLVTAVLTMGNWVLIDHIRGQDRVLLFQRDISASWGLMLATFATWAATALSAYQLWYDELQ